MGVSGSCPFAFYSDFENGLEAVIEKSNSPRDEQQKTLIRSISIKDKDSGKLLLEGSIRFRSREIQTMRFAEVQSENKYVCQEMVSPLPRSGRSMVKILNSPVLDQSSPKHEAALKLQKVYKSFRTRRKLADCAVLIEQSWWKLLDFVELKHSSISFFDLDKQETAISRWSRARTRAAKVGKGLSKNGKAQKLALQHWLEAIDPRHRYGHNLHFYYGKWLNSQSKEPFFYWLDIGEGKEVNIIEKCPRLKLQQQCIKYLGPIERKAYEVAVVDGKLFYKQTGQLLDTINEPKGSKWIFILSTSCTLYVGKKRKGSFQHSSFLAGGATLAAGRIIAEKGVLKAVWPHSGHYRPTPENFQDFISFLMENEVDLTNVELDPIDDEDDKLNVNKGGVYLRSNSSEDDLTKKDCLEKAENYNEDSSSNKVNTGEEVTVAGIETSSSRIFHGFISKLTTLLIPSKDDLLESLKNENKTTESTTSSFPLVSPMDGYETEQESFPLEPTSIEKNNMAEEHDEAKEETIPEESIFQRINSHKEMISYQLGKQLSCKWSTGAGPRIGCLRDYPSGLQSHALEQVNLSPRSKHRLRFDFPLRTSTPTSSNLSHSMSAQSAPIKELVAISSF